MFTRFKASVLTIAQLGILSGLIAGCATHSERTIPIKPSAASHNGGVLFRSIDDASIGFPVTLRDGNIGYPVPLPPNVILDPGQHGPVVPHFSQMIGVFSKSAFVTGRMPPPYSVTHLPAPNATVGTGASQHAASGAYFSGGVLHSSALYFWLQYNPLYKLPGSMPNLDYQGSVTGPVLYFPCVTGTDYANAFEFCVAYSRQSDVKFIAWEWPQNVGTGPADLTTGHVGNYSSVNIDSCNAGPTNCSTFILAEREGSKFSAYAWDWNANGYSYLGSTQDLSLDGQAGHGFFEFYLPTGTACPVNLGPTPSAFWGLTMYDQNMSTHTGSSLPTDGGLGYFGDGACLSGNAYYYTMPDGTRDYLNLNV